jgi:hypothetical protein
VDLAQYTALSPLPYYQSISLPWTIGGNDKDITTTGNHVKRGAESKNIAVVEYYETQMEGLRRVLRNHLEYFSGTVVTEESVWSPPPVPVVTTTSTTSTTTAAPTTTTTTTTTTPPQITADYWWRADSGLTTSGWTAYAGGIDYTLYNVSTADEANGLVLNGTSGYGQSSTLLNDIDASHVFLFFENLDVNDEGAFLGGTQNNIHEVYFQPGGNDKWFVVEQLANNTVYGAETAVGDAATNAVWIDFESAGSFPYYYNDVDYTPTIMSVYTGVYRARFRWEGGYDMYLGRRKQPGQEAYLSASLKEVAIFTSSLSTATATEFRNQMLLRWGIVPPPPPSTTTTTTSTTTSGPTTTTTSTTTTTTTLAQVYDIVGPEMTLTRANNQALYNSSLESGWDSDVSPSGSEWSSGYVSAYPLVFDEVDTGLILTRQNNMNGGGLFNTSSESGWNFDTYTSPEGTEWNSDYTDGVNYGWTDLSNVTSRTYDTFYNALNQQVGQRAVSTELVMHDTTNDKYYKFDITLWGQGGVGTYAYNRQLIDTSSGALIDSPVFVTQSFWNDFSEATTRTYDTFYNALSEQVGAYAVPTELIMHDTINDEYYKFDITAWGSASQGATYAYNRQSIDTSTGVLSGSVVYISRP